MPTFDVSARQLASSDKLAAVRGRDKEKTTHSGPSAWRLPSALGAAAGAGVLADKALGYNPAFHEEASRLSDAVRDAPTGSPEQAARYFSFGRVLQEPLYGGESGLSWMEKMRTPGTPLRAVADVVKNLPGCEGLDKTWDQRLAGTDEEPVVIADHYTGFSGGPYQALATHLREHPIPGGGNAAALEKLRADLGTEYDSAAPDRQTELMTQALEKPDSVYKDLFHDFDPSSWGELAGQYKALGEAATAPGRAAHSWSQAAPYLLGGGAAAALAALLWKMRAKRRAKEKLKEKSAAHHPPAPTQTVTTTPEGWPVPPEAAVPALTALLGALAAGGSNPFWADAGRGGLKGLGLGGGAVAGYRAGGDSVLGAAAGGAAGYLGGGLLADLAGLGKKRPRDVLDDGEVEFREKRAASATLTALIAAKAMSDRRAYRDKHVILRQLMAAAPEEFVVDSDDGKGMVGLTHVPSRFRIHAPAGIVPAEVQRPGVPT